jgi:hypothetical protein
MPTLFTNEEKEWLTGSHSLSVIEILLGDYKK